MNAKKIRENVVHYALYLTIGFIVLSTVLSFWNRYVTNDTRSIIERCEITRDLLIGIETEIIASIDRGVNGYATTAKVERLVQFDNIQQKKDSIFRDLMALLKQQGYDLNPVLRVKETIDNHYKEAKELMASIQADTTGEALIKLKEFSFKDSQAYDNFVADVIAFESKIQESAQSDYEWSILDNAIIQIILVLLSVPILLIASKRLAREVQNNARLLTELSSSNRLYLYDDGKKAEVNATTVVENSISNLRRASDFVQLIAKGLHQEAHRLIPVNLREQNVNTLMGALFEMSIKLKENEEAESQRQWITEGLNQFYEIVRTQQDDLTKLADKAVSFLVKYLKSQQASLYLPVNSEETPYLKLVATYAFDRKKWIEKRIEFNEGLVGQAYQEGSYILMTDIPANYLQITSGLGQAMPRCLLVMPFTYNDKTEALFEVASFIKFEQHQIDFLKKAGEFLAGTLQTVNNNMEMQRLLTQSLEQAETLKAQEEELRQNMEELEATNEAMRRHEQGM